MKFFVFQRYLALFHAVILCDGQGDITGMVMVALGGVTQCFHHHHQRLPYLPPRGGGGAELERVAHGNYGDGPVAG